MAGKNFTSFSNLSSLKIAPQLGTPNVSNESQQQQSAEVATIPAPAQPDVHKEDGSSFGDITWGTGETTNTQIKNIANRVKRLEGKGGFIRKGATLIKVNQTYAATSQPISAQQNTAAGTSLFYWSAQGKTALTQSLALGQLTKQANIAQSDASSKVILSNAPSISGTTSGPTTTSATPVVIPEMTTKILTRGFKIQVMFSGRINCALPGGSQNANIQAFRDGIAIGPIQTYNNTAAVTSDIPFNLSYIDTAASAGTHTYDIRWSVDAGGTLTAVGVNRTLQVIELG